MKSKTVNEFKVGDKISLYGYEGVVMEVAPEDRDGTPCTYLRVKLNNDSGLVGTAYDGGWYGGTNNVVAYGYIE